jgi:MGT family glycosyltransferase
MARFILMTGPVPGHLYPSLPIVRKLIARGHELVWITGRGYEKQVRESGAHFFPLPSEIDSSVVDIFELFPRAKALQGFAQMKHYIKHLFLDACPAENRVMDAVLSDFPAEVYISDTVMYGPYFKGELDGKPSAMISLLPLSIASRDTVPFGLGLQPGRNPWMRIRNRLLNFLVYHVLLHDVNQHANQVRQQLGLPPFRKPFLIDCWEIPALVMHLSTPAFEYPRSDLPAKFHFIGPVMVELPHAFQKPSWWPDLSRTIPVVLVNQGTINVDVADLILPAINALSDQPLLLVAVPVQDRELPQIPANVRAAPFIPFSQLLPHVDLMITNGGYGGTQLALAYGVPLIVAGDTEDKMEVAARVEWSGAGINLKTKSPTAEQIRIAVKEVLSNPTYRQNARRIQADFAHHNAPQHAAELLEALADPHSSL